MLSALQWIGVIASISLIVAGGAAVYGYFLIVWMPGRSFRGSPPALSPRERELAGALRRDVEHLAGAIGERNISRQYSRLIEAERWIAAELAAAGFAVERQEYEADGAAVANLAAELPGRAPDAGIFAVGAHYDTEIDTPGANDNASAVAAGLALARCLADAQPAASIRFVFFVNEEQPYAHTDLMGSFVYARACREQGDDIRGMICLETLGYYSAEPGTQRYPPPLDRIYPDRGDFVAIVGNLTSRRFTRRFVRQFRRHARLPSIGIAAPERLKAIARSDHWSFWRHGYPAVMLTDTADFRYEHYHRPTDTPDRLDYENLARVVLALEAALLALAE